MTEASKVLLSAYACEPDKGSEPMAGWNWAVQMSQHYSVTVLTRENNRKSIEAELARRRANGLHDFDVIYYDLPDWVLALKRRGFMTVSIYYIIWQIFARAKVDADQFDLIHHVTFNNFTNPGYWFRGTDAAVLLGPLGGGMTVAPQYLRLFPWFGIGQRLRALVYRGIPYVPWVRSVYRNAKKILCANQETYALLERHFGDKVEIHLDAGVHDISSRVPTVADQPGPCRFIVVGNIIPRKGWRLALDAFRLLAEQNKAAQLSIEFLGNGSQMDLAQKITAEYGLEKKVTWHGSVPHEQVEPIISAADVLLFPSVRDTSGYVVLEAMMTGMPVICLDHQGGHEMTTPETAIRVPPDDYETTVSDFAAAMLELANDPQRRARMGLAGQQRVADKYTWDKKGEFMRKIYAEVLGDTPEKITDRT